MSGAGGYHRVMSPAGQVTATDVVAALTAHAGTVAGYLRGELCGDELADVVLGAVAVDEHAPTLLMATVLHLVEGHGAADVEPDERVPDAADAPLLAAGADVRSFLGGQLGIDALIVRAVGRCAAPGAADGWASTLVVEGALHLVHANAVRRAQRSRRRSAA